MSRNPCSQLRRGKKKQAGSSSLPYCPAPFEDHPMSESQKLFFCVSKALMKDLWWSLLHSAVFAGESKKEHDQLLHLVLCMLAIDSSIVLTPSGL